MGFFKQLFTWWEGATLTTGWHVRRHGRQVGSDALGNVYYASKEGNRRFVLYNGPNDGLPDEALGPVPGFLKAPTPNLTGTPQAYRPSGALERGGQRAAASGDYEAWSPDAE
jgi:NADH:ubiquinone oxidoreductase subunit